MEYYYYTEDEDYNTSEQKKIPRINHNTIGTFVKGNHVIIDGVNWVVGGIQTNVDAKEVLVKLKHSHSTFK